MTPPFELPQLPHMYKTFFNVSLNFNLSDFKEKIEEEYKIKLNNDKKRKKKQQKEARKYSQTLK
jgi:hypothetical protein